MRSKCGLVAVLGVVASMPGARAAAGEASRAIVKVYVTAVSREVQTPWRNGWSYSGTGSGAVIGGGRILTAAHVVESQTFVQVRLNGTARKGTARVLFVSHAADLALLEVEDPGFLDGVAPLEFGELPAVRDEVAVYGFPNGGETLSITEGVVVRAEHWHYVHSEERLLALQLDAVIAGGNSGGPVLRDGRVVGVAVQSFKDSAIGSAVPVSLVRQFLDDVGDGRLDGIPDLGLVWQKLENPALRKSLGMPAGETGVLITRVEASPAGGVLQAGDVLMAVAGRRVADDGTVELRSGERTDFPHVTDHMALGGRVGLRFLREGTVRTGEVALVRARGEGQRVPRIFDRNADYFIFGGVAFAGLTRNLLDDAKDWAPPELLAEAVPPGKPGEEVVVVAAVLTAEVNVGYEDAVWKALRSVDGHEVRSLRGLMAAVERADGGPYLVFGLADGSRVTIDRARAVATAAEVLARYEVAWDRSAGLRGSRTGPAAPGAAGE